MGQITGGSVSFTRTTRPADFESKSATVTLTFDDPSALDTAADLAKSKALQMVDLKASTAVATGMVETKTEKPASKSQAKKDAEKAAAAKALNDADKLKPAGSDLDGLDPAPQISQNPEDRKEPEAADPDGLDGPKEVSDKDLTDAVQRYIAAAGADGPKNVKDLRGKFVEAPKGLRDIPQDKRADFLKQLAALKK